MCDATNNNSFGLVLTVINEVHKRIDYIIEDIYIFLLPMVVQCSIL